MRLIPAIVALLAATGCATVHNVSLRPDYAEADRTQTVRLSVVTEPSPIPDPNGALLFSRIAQRYVNHHRDFIARTSTSGEACAERTEGVLELRPTVRAEGAEVKETMHARLYRCRDQVEIWSADAAGAWPSKDEHVTEVVKTYVDELGASVEPYVAPAFHILRATLDRLPFPALPNDDYVMEKIELGD